MTKEQLAEQKYPIVESTGSSHWTRMDINEKKRLAFISGFEAAEPKWISVEDELPTKEDVGNEFLVLVLSANYTSYQIAEWTDFDEEDNPFFQIEQAWCGQQMIKRTVTHWMPLPKIPNND